MDGEGYSLDGDGALVLRPKGGQAWTGEKSAFLLYQEVTGNFRLEVQASVIGPGVSEDAPETTDTFGGLLLYPGSLSALTGAPAEHYAIKMGRFVDTAGLRAQVKSRGEAPQVSDKREDSAWENTYLRICRVGGQVWTAYLPSGDQDWIPLHLNDEPLGYDSGESAYPDLPATVSVGILGEVGQVGAGTQSRVIVGRATFTVPETIEGCAYQF
jgi:hypothetical protein